MVCTHAQILTKGMGCTRNILFVDKTGALFWKQIEELNSIGFGFSLDWKKLREVYKFTRNLIFCQSLDVLSVRLKAGKFRSENNNEFIFKKKKPVVSRHSFVEKKN